MTDMPSDRISMKDSPCGFEIVVATKRNIVGLAFYGLIIIVFACIEGIIIYVSMGMNGNARVVIIVILAAVTIYGVHYVYWWFWKFAGKECTLITRDGFLPIKRDICRRLPCADREPRSAA
jgi:hypothetical protein